MSNNNYYQDWKTVLIPRIQQTKAWADMFDGISSIFASNIYKYIYLLRYIRDPSKQDKQINIQQAKFLGFNYKSDLFSEVEYANLVYFLNYYNKYVKGTYDFINFLGWVKGCRFKAVQLWAKGKYDYSDDHNTRDPFERETSIVKNNSLVEGTGTQEWYPTSHVDLEYDALKFKIDESDLWYLFYKCAPIHLVLRSVAAVIRMETFPLAMVPVASNIYTNTHISLPCYVSNSGLFNFYPVQVHLSSNINLNQSYYGYTLGNITSYNELWCFDKDYYKEIFPSVFTFTRDSQATSYERGIYYLKTVPINYPRFEYDPSVPFEQAKGKGLLIENARTNLLLDSNNPVSRQIYLAAGIYAFSGKGQYKLTNITNSKDLGETINSNIIFTLDKDSQVAIEVLSKPLNAWYQLEFGNSVTSYIPTTPEKQVTRAADILQCLNLPTTEKKQGSFSITYSNSISNNCILLKVFESTTKYIEVTRNLDKIRVNIMNSGVVLDTFVVDYKNQLNLSISQSTINCNGIQKNYQLNNCPYPRYVSIGQDNGNSAINGYIERFYFVPSFWFQI